MRTWQIALLAALLAAAGCGKRKLHWSGKRAPQINTSAFIVPIPTGWRDSGEADDEDLAKVVAGMPGAHALVKEDFDGATIIVRGAANTPSAEPACDEIATTVAKNEGAVASKIASGKADGDGTCKWIYTKGDFVGHYWMRFHGDQLLAVMCFAQGETANLTTCEQTIAGVKPATAPPAK